MSGTSPTDGDEEALLSFLKPDERQLLTPEEQHELLTVAAELAEAAQADEPDSKTKAALEADMRHRLHARLAERQREEVRHDTSQFSESLDGASLTSRSARSRHPSIGSTWSATPSGLHITLTLLLQLMKVVLELMQSVLRHMSRFRQSDIQVEEGS